MVIFFHLATFSTNLAPQPYARVPEFQRFRPHAQVQTGYCQGALGAGGRGIQVVYAQT